MRSIFFVVLLNALFLFENQHVEAQLKAPQNQADYLVIYPNQFESDIEEFVNWRATKGVKVQAISINEILSEFGSSDSLEESIRDFVSYALEYWVNPKPRYLLIAGGYNLIPSKIIESEFASSPAVNEDSVLLDEYYAINNYQTDIIPDIAVGRFPAENNQELRNIIQKTINFEDNSFNIDYNYDLLAVADNDDHKIFENIVDNLIENTLPSHLKVISKLYNRKDSEYYGSKEDLFGYWNQGTIMHANYIHSNQDIWTKDSFLLLNDIDNLSLSAKPFIILGVMIFKNFHSKDHQGIVEKLINMQDAGAVASFATSGLTFLDASNQTIIKFYQEIFDNNVRIIGDAVLNIKQKNNFSYINRFTLLGDPMLRIPNRVYAGTKDYKISKDEIVIAPNPCSENTKIIFNLSNSDNVKLEIFDLLGNRKDALLFELSEASSNEIQWDTSMLPNGSYICRLTAGNKIFVKNINVYR